MRTHTLPTTLAGFALIVVSLTACSGTTPTDTTTPTGAKNSSRAKVATPSPSSSSGGVANETGKCVDGQATPTGSKQTLTISDCNLIDVMGSNNTVTAGKTKHLVIEGSGNTIVVASATEVTTLGKNNTVKYEGTEPTFNERSSGNSVQPKVIKK